MRGTRLSVTGHESRLSVRRLVSNVQAARALSPVAVYPTLSVLKLVSMLRWVRPA